MTAEEFNQINWHRGNIVRLTNGKEYPVKKARKNWLVLYSEEYHKFFIVNHAYIDERVSDNVVPTRGELMRAREAEIKKAIDEGRPIPDIPPIAECRIQSDEAARQRERESKECVKEMAVKDNAAFKEKAAVRANASPLAKAEEAPYGHQHSDEGSAPVKPKRKRIIMRKPVLAVERVTLCNDKDNK